MHQEEVWSVNSWTLAYPRLGLFGHSWQTPTVGPKGVIHTVLIIQTITDTLLLPSDWLSVHERSFDCVFMHVSLGRACVGASTVLLVAAVIHPVLYRLLPLRTVVLLV